MRPALAPRDRAHNEQWLCSNRDRFGQGRIRPDVRYVLLAGEKSDKRAALQRELIADSPAKHREASFERVENRTHCDRARHVKGYGLADFGERAKMRWKNDLDHGRVWASTDSTAGRSRTMAVQLSPPLAEP